MIRRKPRRLKPIVPVASLGDIAFLLIIFFVLTTNFMKERHIRLDPPESADIEQLEAHALSVSLDENGDVWLQGGPASVDGLGDTIEGLLAGKREERFVLLKVHKDLTEERYGPVLLELGKADVEIALIGSKAPSRR